MTSTGDMPPAVGRRPIIVWGCGVDRAHRHPTPEEAAECHGRRVAELLGTIAELTEEYNRLISMHDGGAEG